MQIQECITRTLRQYESEHKVWFSTNSQKREFERANTLYLHFVKENFPMLVYPKLIDSGWSHQKKRFDYSNSDFYDLPWHGGCTFYQEEFDGEHEVTLVKVGCDYQHYGDSYWMACDNGKQILECDSCEILSAFLDLVKRRSVEVEG